MKRWKRYVCLLLTMVLTVQVFSARADDAYVMDAAGLAEAWALTGLDDVDNYCLWMLAVSRGIIRSAFEAVVGLTFDFACYRVTNLVSFYCIILREYDAVKFGERDNNASF